MGRIRPLIVDEAYSGDGSEFSVSRYVMALDEADRRGVRDGSYILDRQAVPGVEAEKQWPGIVQRVWHGKASEGMMAELLMVYSARIQDYAVCEDGTAKYPYGRYIKTVGGIVVDDYPMEAM